MTERELERRARRKLAVLRHVEEVSDNVAGADRCHGRGAVGRDAAPASGWNSCGAHQTTWWCRRRGPEPFPPGVAHALTARIARMTASGRDDHRRVDQ